MQIFLKEIAGQLFRKYGSDLTEHKIIFPNRRSALFFTKYLAEEAGKPLWSPSMMTINDLFADQSGLIIADQLKLVFELYKVYRLLRKGAESFDEFYFWGEMLVNDFDDIDKHLVDPSMLFQNLKDLKEIDEKFGGLETEQIEIIRRFWIGFDQSRLTSEKSDFLTVWDILLQLYNEFRANLRQKGIAYEGMVYRDFLNNLKENGQNSHSNHKFHFIGFNALNKCEHAFLEHLKKTGSARFYWDTDQWYISAENHEAGYFIRSNLETFGQDMDDSFSDNNFKEGVAKGLHDWKVYSAPSDVAQAKLIPEIMDDFEAMNPAPDNTAIILSDENMLMPVLNSLPEDIHDINITMGYPLGQTPVYSLVHQLIKLQTNSGSNEEGKTFYHADVLNILKHQYISYVNKDECEPLIELIRGQNMITVDETTLKINDLFTVIFARVDNPRNMTVYLLDILKKILADINLDIEDPENISNRFTLQQEYLYRLILVLNQLDTLVQESNFPLGMEVFIRLLDRIMRNIVIPFSGEPLCGLQVMGILETRALDFENIIILSVNEGILPRSSAGNSYVPYNLREAFGLPTIKHQDSIFAYYFYRILQRAKKVRVIYNNSSAGLKSGEMSRFLLQLKYSRGLNPEFVESRFNILPPARLGNLIERTEEVNDLLIQKYLGNGDKARLSPSALNTWIECNIMFYYRFICGFKERDEVMVDVEPSVFGNILHKVMKLLYNDFTGKELDKGSLMQMLKNRENTTDVINNVFRQQFFKNRKLKINGKNLIITNVLREMTEKILKTDTGNAPIYIESLEKDYSSFVKVKGESGDLNILIGGIIDRVDRINNITRILDYKSGGDKLEINNINDLFDYNSKNRNKAAFQTLMYCEIYSLNEPGKKIRPSLYPVRKMFADDFSDIFHIKKGPLDGNIDDYSVIREVFTGLLGSVISDIFNKSRPFLMTTDTLKCRYCPYCSLCNRQDVK